MTALRRRMLEDMQVRHLSAGTQQVYLQHIARFARYCGRSPAGRLSVGKPHPKPSTNCYSHTSEDVLRRPLEPGQ